MCDELSQEKNYFIMCMILPEYFLTIFAQKQTPHLSSIPPLFFLWKKNLHHLELLCILYQYKHVVQTATAFLRRDLKASDRALPVTSQNSTVVLRKPCKLNGLKLALVCSVSIA